MSRRRRPSLAHQVDRAFAQLEAYGRPKYLDKRAGVSRHWIYSFATRRGYTRDSIRFVRWCQEHFGITWLVQISAAMGAAYLTGLITRGRSAWYLHRLADAMKKLATAVQLAYRQQVSYLPADFRLPDRRLTDRRNREAYPAEELHLLLSSLQERAPLVAAVARAQVALGLRIHEVLRLRDHNLVMSPDGLAVVIKGKGGRIRSIPVPADFEEELFTRARSAGGGRLYPTKALTVQLAVRSACRQAGIRSRGTHGFRHTFAVNTYLEARGAGATDEEARRKVRRLLGHGEHRVDISNIYVPKELVNLLPPRS